MVDIGLQITLVNKYVFTTFGSESFEYFIKDKKEFAIDRIINSTRRKD